MPRDKSLKARRGEPPQPVEPADAEDGDLAPGVRRLATLDELPVRGRIAHHGYVESVTILPPQQAPAYSVTIVDHPAPPGGRRRAVPHLCLVFVGQRRVPGLVAGSRIRYAGMVAPVDQVPTIFNPRYEILPERTDFR